ncbi:MAG: YqfO family protein [Candidatus Komeilibacteria bacterium]|nr:YqfO family protein [Candidatus Komeilibacteria bacterium]
MMTSTKVKIVVFVPESHAEKVRQAMGDAGAGVIGNYTHCSFSSKGQGRFLPQVGAHPAIGEVGKFELVEENRIEMTCDREKLQEVVAAMKQAHLYEEVAFDVYPLEEI